ncbi:MAG: hypothetical protein F6K17_00945 [Okeania sp. SIO3C4]|nr:hypothetical protein [Okeania sp. SIO3B3]NER01296.1 hypothetical protein [Okeania sp. SIO3C4]
MLKKLAFLARVGQKKSPLLPRSPTPKKRLFQQTLIIEAPAMYFRPKRPTGKQSQTLIFPNLIGNSCDVANKQLFNADNICATITRLLVLQYIKCNIIRIFLEILSLTDELRI